MVRLVVMFVAVLYLSAATGFAQSVKEMTTQPAAGSPTKQAQKLDVSAKAAGLDRIAAAGERSAVKSATTPAPRAMSKRNKILLIGAAVLAAVIVGVAVSGGYSSDDGYQ